MILLLPTILSFCLFVVSPVYGSLILEGTGVASQTTFNLNNVLSYTADVDAPNALLYVGRNDPTLPVGINDPVAEYAISVAAETFTQVFPYAPYNVDLNGVENQVNPLFGQQISLLGLYQSTPFAVTADNPQNMYWTKTRLSVFPAHVQSVENVLDAAGAVTSGIVAAAGAKIFEVTKANQILGSYIFATVKPHGGVFGAIGSGVAAIMTSATTLVQLSPYGNGTINSLPLDGTQTYVKGNGNGTVNAAAVDMYFDPIVQRLYIVYSATTGAAVGDSVRGLVIGYVTPMTTMSAQGALTEFAFTLTDFVPAAALVGAGSTHVAGVENAGAPATITLSKFRSLYTSTGLTYGVVVGTSTGANATRTVLALPLVNKSVDSTNTTWPTDPQQGMLASKIVAPGTNLMTYFNPDTFVHNYTGRGFQKPATTLADVSLQTDVAVAVGGGLTPGVIQAIETYKDTVFVATLTGATEQAGIFASQALFDGNGAIKGWTAWQRVMACATPGASVYGLAYQPNLGKMFSMQGLTQNTVDIIATSTWFSHDKDGLLGGTTTDAAVGFIDQINSQFPTTQGGVQAVFDFPKNTVGFAAAGSTQRLSVMVFTGNQQIVIAQTGQDTAGGVFTPCVGNFATDKQISTNGAVTVPAANTRLISVSGGVLQDLHAITSAIVVSDGVTAYLVIAGVGGVAVLRPGWPAAGLQKNFANLPASAFAVVGNYTNVRKLVTDGTNLYVLTNTTFDRIPVAQLAAGAITPTVLATPSVLPGPYGSFSDVVVSGKLALLATSQGLYRVGNGNSIATATQSTQLAWTNVPLAESVVGVTRIQPISPTGLPQDCAGDGTGNSGQVYVVSASTSKSLASVYRISLADTRAQAITADTVQVIPDYFVQSTTNAYAALGAYRNYFRTDGALFTDSRSNNVVDPIVFQAFPSLLRTGVEFYPRTAKTISLENSIYAITVGNLVQNSGLGSLILPTGNGMQVLE